MIERLFAIPIYKGRIELTNELDFIVKQEFKSIEANNGFQSTDTYILNNKPLSKLKKSIENHLLEYVHNDLKIKKHHKFKMLNSWCMKHIDNNYADQHSHVNSFISGIVYLKCNQQSGNLNFHKAHGYNNLFSDTVLFDYLQATADNCKVYSVTPQPGDVFLFPSSLLHSVNVNKSKEERYCIAFNFYPTGDFQNCDVDKLSIKLY